MKHEHITDHVKHLRRKRIYSMENLFIQFLVVERGVFIPGLRIQRVHPDWLHEMNLNVRCPETCSIRKCERSRKIIIHSVLCRFFMSTAVSSCELMTPVLRCSRNTSTKRTFTSYPRKLSSIYGGECIASLIANLFFYFE